MVNIMVRYKVKVDKQGRIVIPAKIRRMLNLKPGSELILDIRNSMIILEPSRNDLDKKIDEWYQKMLDMKIKARALEIKGGKWMSDEYVRRKIGFY